MFKNIEKLYKNVYAVVFLACIAVLPMSDTIALRNIFLVCMVLLIFVGLISSSSIRHDFYQASKIIPIPVIFWITYLCVFPFWAPVPEIAWENLRGQWGESIVTWIVGFGAAVLCMGSGPSLWKLGFASAFPLLVHLLLAGIAYFGLFSDDYYGRQSLSGLCVEILRWASGEISPIRQFHPIDNGFLGIETQPGVIGYASSMAIGIFAVCFFSAKRDNNIKEMIKASVLIVLFFLSILIARTRGGLLFGGIVIGIAAIFFNINYRPMRVKNLGVKFSEKASPYRNFFIFAGVLLLGCIIYAGTKADPRWLTMVDKVKAGFSIADPISTLCNGLSPAEELAIRNRLVAKPPSYVQEVIEGVQGQDGGRVILMRAGIQLVLDNPIGLDGSRQSYERLMRVKCNGTPALHFANAHNSWIDLTLAVGWAGAILFLLMFLYFLRYSLMTACEMEFVPILAVLGVFAAFWIIRGFFDTLYREHYLQMQALIISYLYMACSLKAKSKKSS